MDADRPRATVAGVFRRYGAAVRDWAGTVLSSAQRRVMTAIEQCRSAALGGHVARSRIRSGLAARSVTRGT